ncbi:MAG: AbrB/MazE/SpoVT family DNA-binding domain-containing protein [candidate division WOR-3 bacterium]
MKQIQAIGRAGNSNVVVIPAWWLKLNGLKKGDKVEVEITEKFITIKKPKEKAGTRPA